MYSILKELIFKFKILLILFLLLFSYFYINEYLVFFLFDNITIEKNPIIIYELDSNNWVQFNFNKFNESILYTNHEYNHIILIKNYYKFNFFCTLIQLILFIIPIFIYELFLFLKSSFFLTEQWIQLFMLSTLVLKWVYFVFMKKTSSLFNWTLNYNNDYFWIEISTENFIESILIYHILIIFILMYLYYICIYYLYKKKYIYIFFILLLIIILQSDILFFFFFEIILYIFFFFYKKNIFFLY